jgi:hypothetical protein
MTASPLSRLARDGIVFTRDSPASLLRWSKKD